MIGMTYIITCKFSAIIYTDDMPAQPLGGHMKLNPLFLTTLVVLMLFVIVDQILRRRAYKKVQDLYGQHRSDELLAYLEGRYARLFFPAYNRTYMKFNACLQKDDAERVQIALEELLATKSSDEQRSDLVIRAFEFYLKQGKLQRREGDARRDRRHAQDERGRRRVQEDLRNRRRGQLGVHRRDAGRQARGGSGDHPSLGLSPVPAAHKQREKHERPRDRLYRPVS